MSELDALLDPILGEDEWARHRALEGLREEGASAGRVAELGELLGTDDASRRNAARMALAALAHPRSPAADEAMAALTARLGADDPDLRILAASALGEAGNPGAGDPLVAALEDPEPNVVAAAADALGQLAYAPGLEALVEATRSPSLWVRAAAVVALGQLEDERAVPALERVAREPGLERPLVEALRTINHPHALRPLKLIRETAPREAVIAAGGILAAHPEIEPPDWMKEAAIAEADALRETLLREDDPAVARALGVAATPEAIETLLALVGPPKRSEAALTGLLAVPPPLRSDALAREMEHAEGNELVDLLALLPPQTEEERVRGLVPFLEHSEPAVRSAAAEALGRAPAERTLPLLTAELDRRGVAPEVIRAMGGLGDVACGALLPLLSDPSAEVRAAAAEALQRCGGGSAAEALEEALEREADDVARRAFLRAIGVVGGPAAVALLRSDLEDADPETRLAAIEGLGATGSADAVPPLERMLGGPDPDALAAIRAFGDLAVPEAAPLLERVSRSGDSDRRRAAARAMVAVADHVDPATVDALRRDDDEWVRVSAARILGRQGVAGATALERMSREDPSPAVRSEARAALDRGR